MTADHELQNLAAVRHAVMISIDVEGLLMRVQGASLTPRRERVEGGRRMQTSWGEFFSLFTILIMQSFHWSIQYDRQYDIALLNVICLSIRLLMLLSESFKLSQTGDQRHLCIRLYKDFGSFATYFRTLRR